MAAGAMRGDMLVHGEGELAHEMFDQRRDVFAALAQRRQLDPEHVQPVEKVGPECCLPRSSFSRSLLVAATHAEIDFDDLIAAYPGNLPLLQHAQADRSASSG